MTEPTIIKIPAQGWTPRPYQLPVWKDLQNEVPNVLVIGHRRFGKDELGLNDCAIQAAKYPGNYWYMLPQKEHVRLALWNSINPKTKQRRVLEAFPAGFRRQVIENEMIIKTQSRGGESMVQFLGSDNYDSAVGGSPRGIYFSEWALCDPQALAILRPIVAENGGVMRFLTTARGKNHAFKMLANAGKPDWAVHLLPNSQTHVFSDEQMRSFLEENIALYGPEVGKALFEQEYECSFEEIVPGSFYLDLLLKAEREGRISDIPFMPAEPVYAAFDLGFTDPTAVWYVQALPDGWLHVIGYDEWTKTSIPEIIPELRKRQGFYGKLLLPHDGAHSEVTSGTTTESLLTRAGFSCEIMPQTDDGAQIQSVRMLLSRCRFHATACERGLACLRHFHNKSKTEGGKTSWAPKPVHDWSSHGAKAFATLAYFADTIRYGAKAQTITVRDPFSGDRQRTGSGWMR